MVLRKLRVILILVTFTLLFSSGSAQAASYDNLQESLICPACLEERMTVASCADSTAEQARLDIRQKLALGQSEEKIIKTYVDQYGEGILAVPPQRGFGLVAWLVPPLALVGTGVLVLAVLKMWVKNHNNRIRGSEKPEHIIDSVDEERINAEMRKYV